MYLVWSSGTASSAKIAVTGHSGSQAPQSMHSSGSMKYIASSSVAWMQSTGQTSTQLASLTPMQGSVMTYVMASSLHRCRPSPSGRASWTTLGRSTDRPVGRPPGATVRRGGAPTLLRSVEGANDQKEPHTVNASAASTAARAAGILLIVALAVGAGLAAGNLIQRISGDRSITANAEFSVDAIADLHALRADESPSVPHGYVDYARRHATATQRSVRRS